MKKEKIVVPKENWEGLEKVLTSILSKLAKEDEEELEKKRKGTCKN